MTLDMFCSMLLTVCIIVLLTSLVSHMACQQLELRLLKDHNTGVKNWRDLFMVVKKQRDEAYEALDLSYEVLKVIADPRTTPEQVKEVIDRYFKTVLISKPEMELKEAAKSMPDGCKLAKENKT